jgi:hypothetical protein
MDGQPSMRMRELVGLLVECGARHEGDGKDESDGGCLQDEIVADVLAMPETASQRVSTHTAAEPLVELKISRVSGVCVVVLVNVVVS